LKSIALVAEPPTDRAAVVDVSPGMSANEDTPFERGANSGASDTTYRDCQIHDFAASATTVDRDSAKCWVDPALRLRSMTAKFCTGRVWPFTISVAASRDAEMTLISAA